MTKFYDHLFCIYENSSFPSYSILVFTSLLLPDIKTCWLHWAMTPFSALKSWKLPLKTSMHYAVNILRSPRNVFFFLLCRNDCSVSGKLHPAHLLPSLRSTYLVWNRLWKSDALMFYLKTKTGRITLFRTSRTKIMKTLTVFPVTGMEGDLNADTGTSNWKHLCLHA